MKRVALPSSAFEANSPLDDLLQLVYDLGHAERREAANQQRIAAVVDQLANHGAGEAGSRRAACGATDDDGTMPGFAHATAWGASASATAAPDIGRSAACRHDRMPERSVYGRAGPDLDQPCLKYPGAHREAARD